MSRTAIAGFLLLCIVVFGGGVFLGMRFRRGVVTNEAQAQKGWCCIPKTERCEIADSQDDCRSKNGGAFNWDKDTCEELCYDYVTRSR